MDLIAMLASWALKNNLQWITAEPCGENELILHYWLAQKGKLGTMHWYFGNH